MALQRAILPSSFLRAEGIPYHASAGFIIAAPCVAQNRYWTFDSVTGFVHYNATQASAGSVPAYTTTNAVVPSMPLQCLTAVPPNVNVTVAVVATLLDAETLLPVPLTGHWVNGSASASLAVSLTPTRAYLLVISVVSSRDTAWQEDPLDVALAQASTLVDSPGVCAWLGTPLDTLGYRLLFVGVSGTLSSIQAEHATWWANFWNASSLYLGEDNQLLEGFWYGMQVR